ncbi:MAG: virulence protein RhuM/Fic/DOC family protein [Microbacteriaceae bacterium]|nr:virulence protein RhuM/Fic/DOC family protein [Microbacteriaceae bacterium]
MASNNGEIQSSSFANGHLNNELALYSADGVELTLPIDRELGTVWVTQAQIVELFDVDVSGVSRHIRNIFKDGEVDEESNLQKMQIAHSDRPVTLYSLDVVLAVGYRTNSARAIAFRKWATEVLQRYLLQGVAVNQNRLKELEKVVEILSRSSDELVSGVSNVIAQYLPAITLLRDYDEGSIQSDPNTPPTWLLTLKEAREVIADLRSKFPNDALFGKERSEGLDAAIGAIYQGFAGQDIYPTVEQKAAHLLYFVVKNHPLTDGNKRSAAALFVTFLDKNRLLRESGGAVSIDNNTLAALTLMVAMSDPKEKDLMVQLIVRMLSTSA